MVSQRVYLFVPIVYLATLKRNISKCGDHILYILDVELTCSGCLGETSVSWRKERVGEYIGDGEKQTDWLSQDRTSSEGESCRRE